MQISELPRRARIGAFSVENAITGFTTPSARSLAQYADALDIDIARATNARNEQLEAITLLKPDTLLAIAEAKVAPGDDILAAFEAYPGNGTAHSRMLSIAPHDPFAVTSVATAPDGGIFLLERRFSLAGGVGMEIRHVDSADIHEGARLEGKVLANVGFQNTNIDNMEGIAVRKGRNGETLLYLISDNNYSPLQRTLLLMFELRH